jgi:uncharacterized Zn finger protein
MKALGRRVERLGERVPEGCPACREQELIRILVHDDADPPSHCNQCGKALTGTTCVRLVQVERGPL